MSAGSSPLFRVATERAVLTWGAPRGGREPVVLGAGATPAGRLAVQRRREDIAQLVLWRAPSEASGDEASAGPRLYEQLDYPVFLRAAQPGGRVELLHRDPVVLRDLNAEDDGAVVHGYVNFGGQVGRAAFTVAVDGAPEFDFELEVFPSKLDYASDYRALTDDVQDMLTALALEYLRPTYQQGRTAEPPPRGAGGAHVEWALLLRHGADDLERALTQVASAPARGLSREPVGVRADRVKRVDGGVRAAVLRRGGRGEAEASAAASPGVPAGARLTERRARPTLDTPEHRWLAQQLTQLRRRVAAVRSDEARRAEGARRARVLSELDALEARLSRLARLAPLAAAEGEPPPGFASMQLLGAPGYREAYQSFVLLSRGLRVESGGPVRLAVKDLALLYEYWCYLALLSAVSEETGARVPVRELLAAREHGLHVRLERGHESAVRFELGRGRRVTVAYNPRFADAAAVLVPQRPDVLLTIEDPGWPPLRLLVDAKYRVEASPEYVARYGAPGPPEDALNALHRYRDAILERGEDASAPDGAPSRPRRVVVQAAALYPYREPSPGAFGQSALWRGLDRVGIGAIPLLPGQLGYLRAWLRAALGQGGWALADRALSYRAQERAHLWRAAAAETVLVGLLRGGEERAHLDWIAQHRCYYMPMARSQARQHSVRHLAVYSPTALRTPGAVTHVARVESVEVVRRGQIPTPWAASHDRDALCVLYRLGALAPLAQPIVNRGAGARGGGRRVGAHAWTSRLALERARALEELLLETEPEWRLYEDLGANGVRFELQLGGGGAASHPEDTTDPRGRVWFVTEGGARVRYAGFERFLVRTAGGEEVAFPRIEQVLAAVRGG